MHLSLDMKVNAVDDIMQLPAGSQSKKDFSGGYCLMGMAFSAEYDFMICNAICINQNDWSSAKNYRLVGNLKGLSENVCLILCISLKLRHTNLKLCNSPCFTCSFKSSKIIFST